MDAVTGQQVWYWNPDAFGVAKPSDSTTSLPNGVVINLHFPGQYYDQQSRLYYNHNLSDTVAQDNPELGRYMEPDPLGLKAGLNPYAYAGNDPVNKTDSSGLCLGPLVIACYELAVDAAPLVGRYVCLNAPRIAAFAEGLLPSSAGSVGVAGVAGAAANSTLKANKAAGAAWEQAVLGKLEFPGGTVIPPTRVNIERP